jgi:hypothetical protein
LPEEILETTGNGSAFLNFVAALFPPPCVALPFRCFSFIAGQTPHYLALKQKSNKTGREIEIT